MVGTCYPELTDGKVGRVLHLNEMANSTQYNKGGGPGTVLGVATTLSTEKLLTKTRLANAS